MMLCFKGSFLNVGLFTERIECAESTEDNSKCQKHPPDWCKHQRLACSLRFIGIPLLPVNKVEHKAFYSFF